MDTIYSPELLAELQPHFLIIRNGVSFSYEQMQQVKSLKREAEVKKKALFDFEFLDYNFAHWERPLFEYGDKISVQLGYYGKYAVHGPYDVILIDEDITDEGIVLKVSCEAGGALSRSASRRVFSKGTLLGMFRQLAEENGYILEAEDLDQSDFDLDAEYPIVQAGETDGLFLSRVAKDHGWVFSIDGDKAVLTPPLIRKALGTVTLTYRDAYGSLLSVKVKRKKPRVTYKPKKGINEKKTPEAILAEIISPQTQAMLKTVGVSLKSFAAEAFAKSKVKLTAKGSVVIEGIDTQEIEQAMEGVGSFMHILSDRLKKTPHVVDNLKAMEAMGMEIGDSDPDSEGGETQPSGKIDEAKGTAKRKRRGRAKYKEGALETVDIVLKFGAPFFRIQQHIILEGVGAKLSGAYHIVKIEDSGVDSYAQAISLCRGFGASKKGKKKTASTNADDAEWGLYTQGPTNIGLATRKPQLNPSVVAAAAVTPPKPVVRLTAKGSVIVETKKG